MANNTNGKRTKGRSSDSIPKSAQSDIRSVASIENQDFNKRMKDLEELFDNRLSKQDAEIKQLQDKIENLEKQASQHIIQIKCLEDKVINLQQHDSKVNRVKSIISDHANENISNQPHVITQQEDGRSEPSPSKNLADDLTAHSKPEDVITDQVDLNIQEQERNPVIQSEEISSTTSKLAVSNSDQKKSITSSQEFHNDRRDQDATKQGDSKGKIGESKNSKEHGLMSSSASITSTECSNDSSKKGRSVGSGKHVFTRWMDSRDDKLSLWANKEYRFPLLSYIGKMYGLRNDIQKVLAPLTNECNNASELDELYAIIKQFEKQPGAKEYLREWQHQNRPDNRLRDVKTMLEFNRAKSSSLDGLKLSSTHNLDKIIDRGTIKAYFDMICRDGLISAEIGEYLQLNKENIFGGSDYNSPNERLTHANVNLTKSTIDLADKRVDLITCFVTLHHVPQLNPMLLELVRILRPGGYLIIREHDCKNERSLRAKYLNFVHAFMMIAQVGEFAKTPAYNIDQSQHVPVGNSESNTRVWKDLKSDIIQETSSIQYRTHAEWQQELERVGFGFIAKVDYDLDPSHNHQALYYAVYQLNPK